MSAALGIAAALKAAAYRNPRQVVGLGDSRVAAFYLDNVRRVIGNRAPFNYANAILGGKFFIDENFGVSGDRTDQLFARLPAALATKAGILYLQAGVNNIGAVASGTPAYTYVHAVSGATIDITTVARTAANDLIAICEAAKAKGMQVVIEQEVGANTLSTVEKVSALMDLRQYLADYVRNTSNVFMHDAIAIVMQPGSITLKTDVAYDTVHVNSRGAFLWGLSLSTILDKVGAPGSNRLIKNSAEVLSNGRRQLLSNPVFSTATGGSAATINATANTTSGSTTLAVTSSATLMVGVAVSGTGIPAGTTITAAPGGGGAGNYTMSNAATASNNGITVAVTTTIGSVPSGWTAYTNSTNNLVNLSTVADANGLGNNVVANISFGAAANLFRLEQSLSGTAAGAWNSALQAGDIVQAVTKVEITGTPSCLSALYLYCSFNTGSGGATSDNMNLFGPSDSANSGPNQAATLILETKPFVLPASVGAYPFGIISVRAASSSAGTANIKIHQIGLRRVSQ